MVDPEWVTKQFYNQFQKQHELFLEWIEGLQSRPQQEWYASLILNRLMFLYFLQKKGFLADVQPGGAVIPNRNYLRDRLQHCQQRQPPDPVHFFYRSVLLPLFYSGLSSPQRTPALERLLGQVPYLNRGLFAVHSLEMANPNIHIANEAFVQIFDFFDQWDWRLDQSPATMQHPYQPGKGISPDVLGYIVEKYINQKQMGAYYTKEDITKYISKNTIIPFLLSALEKRGAIASSKDPIWQLLQTNPDRYIYPAVKYGIILPSSHLGESSGVDVIPLPPDIEAGMDDVSKRDGWNRPADPAYGLPTETWREYGARRQWCLEVRQKLASGEIHRIADLITFNLNLRQLIQDRIETWEDPEGLKAVYMALTQLSVLDPTCGSGAFLLAALAVLEPLYQGCLQRMQQLVDALDRETLAANLRSTQTVRDFRKILAQVAKQPNRNYFVLKSIILDNLYGLDLMAEAVEICKLQLVLKLVSQVKADHKQENCGLEQLPDIDFNIRVGNALVGFTTHKEAQKALIDHSFQPFRLQQIKLNNRISNDSKQELQKQPTVLNDELNQYLACKHGVDPDNVSTFAAWLIRHQPFHWFVEFYKIMAGGGFSVIIGNPPYIESTKIRNSYLDLNHEMQPWGNLYAYVLSRCLTLIYQGGFMGMIVPMSAFTTDRMLSLSEAIFRHSKTVWISNYGVRPAKLFDGVNWRLSIVIGAILTSLDTKIYTTKHLRWYSEERDVMFDSLKYCEASPEFLPGLLPKCSSNIAYTILRKLIGSDHCSAQTLVTANQQTQNLVHYQEATQYWVKAMNHPPFYEKNGIQSPPSHSRFLYFLRQEYAHLMCCLMNSSLFYIYFNILSDCYHLGDALVRSFPVANSLKDERRIQCLAKALMDDLAARASIQQIRTGRGDTIRYASLTYTNSKPIIDKIDRLLANHYNFTDTELDFILNYDIKYRMGKDLSLD